MDTPVLFLIYNRPQETGIVFDVFKRIKPRNLFVASDGPRAIPGDAARCEDARRIAVHPDWDCNLRTLLRDNNLGCGKAVSSAISWFFNSCEKGIILEDDCLPDVSFFQYCEELLERYKNDTRVMMISGDNFGPLKQRPESYLFSRYAHVWGWASWARAWAYYDFDMHSFSRFEQEGRFSDVFQDEEERAHWKATFSNVAQKKIDTWDYQWAYTIASQGALCAVPTISLVRNIGFGKDATHTKGVDSRLSSLRYGSLATISHPQFVLRDVAHDREVARNLGWAGNGQPRANRIKRYLTFLRDILIK